MKDKPMCVDCNKRPMKAYCRCLECLVEFEKRTAALNAMANIRTISNKE